MTSETKDVRLHCLVKYIIKEYKEDRDGKPLVDKLTNQPIYSVRYEFAADNLRKHLYPWYYVKYWFIKPSLYETNYFCKILGNDGILKPGETYGQWQVQPHNLENAREAYFSEIYLDKKAWVLAIYISTILNAIAAIALVLLTYLSDRSSEVQQKQSEELKQLHEALRKAIQEKQRLESQMPDSLRTGEKNLH
jgi:hypothetical protein